MATLILPIASPEATLARAGGKGMNLAVLARAGFPVPPGFLVTTEAYDAFVEGNQIRASLLSLASRAAPDDPAALEAASADIHGLFAPGQIPRDISDAIVTSYQSLASSSPPVAVRSSATAEDLPGLSFAGQQDTYLNIVGAQAVLQAVVQCWASLWTARAMGYRARNGIPPASVALAVVVQAMVQSEASGVMFTANPLTGLRSETVIDATFGLGEALVSGQVEPDHYVVETASGSILQQTRGRKALEIRGRAGGGTETLQAEAGGRQALADNQVRALAALGRQIAAHYDSPQDIEWAWAEGQLFILQSRPITSLYPVPAELAAHPLRVMFSFGAVQGMLDPMTPLGQDALRFAVSGIANLLGYRVTYAEQGVFRVAGERIWVDATAVIRNRLGRKVAQGALSFIEPSVSRALQTVWGDPRLAPTGDGFGPGTLARLLPRLLPIVGRVVGYMLDPDGSRQRAISETDGYLTRLQNRSAVTGDPQTKLAQRAALLRELSQAFPQAIPTLVTGLVAGMASFNALRLLAARGLPRREGEDPAQWVLELTRGLPNNVTTEMDLRLWETARAIRSDSTAAGPFQSTPAAQLAADYLAGRLPAAARSAVAQFLNQYGRRGLAEIDFGRARWQEDPTALMQALQSYLRIDDERQAPDAVFKRGELVAAEAQAKLENAVRRMPGGAFRVRLVRFLAGRLRSLLGLRESPKFFIVRLMGILREGLLDSGRELASAGVLARADDIFFMHLNELDELARGPSRDWRTMIAGRRAVFQREKLRRQIPRLLLSDGRAFYEGMGEAPVEEGEGVLVGSPVSPGVAEGLVRVVFDPHQTQLSPGEILVCPGTDPAWTPLFLAAAGLVMEVGGLMTHGSVVAREYGIPAVVGVHEATTRLKTGQRIRVDGNTGRVRLLPV